MQVRVSCYVWLETSFGHNWLINSILWNHRRDPNLGTAKFVWLVQFLITRGLPLNSSSHSNLIIGLLLSRDIWKGAYYLVTCKMSVTQRENLLSRRDAMLVQFPAMLKGYRPLCGCWKRGLRQSQICCSCNHGKHVSRDVLWPKFWNTRNIC